jgi:hypothetical protein
MSRFSSKKLFVGAGLALVVGMAVFIAWLPLSPTTKPGVSVLGRTNDPATGPTVLFNLTNQSESQMSYLVSAPQIKTTGLGSPVPEPRGSGFYLPPHQATNFTVKAPSGTDAWRVPVFYGYLPSGTERLRGKIRYNMRANWIRLKHREIPKWINDPMFDVYLVYSPDVAVQPGAEPDGAAKADTPLR